MGIRNPNNPGFIGVRRGARKPSSLGAVAQMKCPKKGCDKPDGHAPKTHGTQRDIRAAAMAQRGSVALGRFDMPHSPRVVNALPHDQYGRRVISARLRKAYADLASQQS